MTIESAEERAFLFELYTATGGDTEVQASTQEIGEKLGIDPDQASSLAESLFIQGFAELKTLSGGIGITRLGMETLDVSIPPQAGDPDLSLGTGTVLEDTGKGNTLLVVDEIKDRFKEIQGDYEAAEALVIDIKTIEMQLTSPQPKTAVIKEVFRSIQGTLSGHAPQDLQQKLEMLINN